MCFLESKYLDGETVCHNDELECPLASDDPWFHLLKTLRAPDHGQVLAYHLAPPRWAERPI
jgi:hypothetical protein